MTFEEWLGRFKKEHRWMIVPRDEGMKIIYNSIVDSITPENPLASAKYADAMLRERMK